MKKFLKTLSSITAILLIGAAAQAALELGSVNSNKLKSFADYFEPYLVYQEPYFHDEESRQKLLAEAKDINAWLNDDGRWPAREKVTAGMYYNAARLHFYFSHIGIKGAYDKAVRHARRAAEMAPEDFAIQLQTTLILAEGGGDFAEETARFAQKALELDAGEAEGKHIHYHLTYAYYHAGRFREAYEHLQKQAALDPEYLNTRDLKFAFDSWVEAWGRVPEKVKFSTNADGDSIPRPA